MDLLLIVSIIVSGPVVCFIFFFKSLRRLIKYKQGLRYNPDEKLKTGIKNQTIIMIVTGIIGTVVGAIAVYVIVELTLLISGAIPAM